jgi:hypothetical protein
VKLQYPDRETAVKEGEFEGFKSDFFYCDSSYIHFRIKKDLKIHKIRSELRQMEEWSSGDMLGRYWFAKLKGLKPKIGVDSYTWMQIHGTTGSYNFPILNNV